jgi:hypothetical protein
MSVVEVDERGRMTIPRELGLRNIRAVVIPAGAFFVVVPIEGDPYDLAKGWLRAEEKPKELKNSADNIASDDAIQRAKRRNQIC